MTWRSWERDMPPMDALVWIARKPPYPSVEPEPYPNTVRPRDLSPYFNVYGLLWRHATTKGDAR